LENKLNNYYHAKSHTVQTGGQKRLDERSVMYALTLEEELFFGQTFIL